MERGTFTPLRLVIFLLITTLALGIGVSLAQTQGTNQPAGDTPKNAAATPAEQPKTEAAEEPATAASEPEVAGATDAEVAAANATAGRTLSRMRGTTQMQRK